MGVCIPGPTLSLVLHPARKCSFEASSRNPNELEEKSHIDHEGFLYVKKISSLFDRTNPDAYDPWAFRIMQAKPLTLLDRFQPPLTGFASMHNSIFSEYIVNLFKEAGA
ncbi:hypothetical protein HBI23_256550 [Parastagonospora nodorum]|nr:hypothetical protein HBI23_256550 [Parastagonospora nodorum]KAH5621657.1 hypothetical protein HBI51_249820 [Parastagonospora nodorum]KAH6132818.1 hypothetical protein HBI68_255020 [Parastagonospora nodorum]KAH6383210.1 hypothetical protein HBI60_258240 [Parastagonospora nodorum]